jgi:hypothetical protein
MPQLQAAIVGHNNTRAAVTGQEELLVRVNSTGTFSQDVNIKNPLSQLIATDSVSVVLTSDQADLVITPVIIVSSGDSSTLIGNSTRSISFASNGTANALVTFDGGATIVALPAGTTVNMDAGGLGNFYQGNSFGYDTATNAGASLIITYNI